MRIHTRVLMAGLAVTMLMAFAVTAASAGRLSSSNQLIRSTYRRLTFAVSGLPSDTCQVTLEGSLHTRTITKSAGTLLGLITRVTTAACSLPTTILNLPWHVRYNSFSGTLPNITLLTVTVSRASFGAGIFTIGCLGEPEIEGNFVRNTATGAITAVRVVTRAGFPVRSYPSNNCPEEARGTFSGEEGTLEVLGSTTRITITLI